MPNQKEVRLREFAILLAKRIGEVKGQDERPVDKGSLRAAFRAFADTVPAVIWIAGPDGVPTFQSRQWHDMFGENADWAETLHPEDRSGAYDSWMHSVRTGEPYRQLARFRGVSGGYRLLMTHAQPVMTEDGAAVAYWIGSSCEIEAVTAVALVA